MATYMLLQNFTEQGMRAVKDTTKRAEAVRAMGKKIGVNVKDVYWTLGPFDVITIYDAPDESTATTFALSVAHAGNVRCQTLRAFNADEAGKILTKMAQL